MFVQKRYGRVSVFAISIIASSIGVVFPHGMTKTSFGGLQKKKSQMNSEREKVKKAAQELISAAGKRDVKAFISLLGAHTKTQYEAFELMESIDRAVQKRFKRSVLDGMTMKKLVGSFSRKNESMHVEDVLMLDKNTRIVVIWETRKTKDGMTAITELHWRAIKENGQWKIVLPDKGRTETVTRKNAKGERITVSLVHGRHLSKKESERHKKETANRMGIYKDLLRRVKNGEFKTFEELKAAALQAEKKKP